MTCRTSIVPPFMRHGILIFVLVICSCSSAAIAQTGVSSVDSGSEGIIWGERADSAQAALDKNFWFSLAEIYFSTSARGETRNYWWQAHAIDALVMGYRRTGSSFYTGRINALYQGIISSGGFTDNYNDDMEWMALALLRTYEATKKSFYLNEANSLWQTVLKGWSDNPGGGGIQWRTTGIYKNVPANAPACILACKLYEDFGDSANLSWALRLHAWIDRHLVDDTTGIILDGISYQDTVGTSNHGSYTYNYGTYIGASLYLFQVTRDTSYLDEAVREANVADSIFSTSSGILRSEGTGDGGLFKGIYVYYLSKLILEPALNDSMKNVYTSFIVNNADTLWDHAQQPGTALFNDDWQQPPSGSVTLSEDLSGVTLLESVAEVYGDTAITAVNESGRPTSKICWLYQNFPNPFNPSTEIRIRLNRNGIMSLKLYNVLGQLVDVVAEGYKAAGEYSFSVNMDRFSSGVYFYSLTEGASAVTRRMLLLK